MERVFYKTRKVQLNVQSFLIKSPYSQMSSHPLTNSSTVAQQKIKTWTEPPLVQIMNIVSANHLPLPSAPD